MNSKQAAGVDAKRSLVLADYAGNISVTALMNSRQNFLIRSRTALIDRASKRTPWCMRRLQKLGWRSEDTKTGMPSISSKPAPTGDRGFESYSLQRRVWSEPRSGRSHLGPGLGILDHKDHQEGNDGRGAGTPTREVRREVAQLKRRRCIRPKTIVPMKMRHLR